MKSPSVVGLPSHKCLQSSTQLIRLAVCTGLPSAGSYPSDVFHVCSGRLDASEITPTTPLPPPQLKRLSKGDFHYIAQFLAPEPVRGACPVLQALPGSWKPTTTC